MLSKTYKIATEKLLIRCYEPTDAEQFKKAIDQSLDHLIPWLPWAKDYPKPIEYFVDRLRKYRGQFDLGQDYVFGIFDKDESSFMGSIGLHNRIGPDSREIGYWISIEQTNKGYATEAVKALIKIGFEIEQLKRIEIRCSPRNEISQRIPNGLGFRHEATLKDRYTDSNEQPDDMMIWSLFKEDYDNSDLRKIVIQAFDVCDRPIESS